MKFSSFIREPLLYLLPLLLVLWYANLPSEDIPNEAILTTDGNASIVKFPYKNFNAEEHKDFKISLYMKNSALATYRIIPDDCLKKLTINGEEIPVKNIHGTCDYENGFIMDLSKYLNQDENFLEFELHNNSGTAALSLIRLPPAFWSLKNIAFCTVLILSLSLLLRKLKFSHTAVLLIALGVFIRLVYFSYTTPFERVYDLAGHLEYIGIIANENRIPSTLETWSSNHPPTYYLFGAFLSKISSNYEYLLSQFALLCSFASLIYGVAFIKMLNLQRRFFFLSGLIFVLYPGFVLSSTRIGNDVPAYLGMFICMCYAQMWWKRKTAKNMIFATLGAAIAIMFKSTGIAVAGAWAVIWIIGILYSLKIPSVKGTFACVVIMLLALFAAQYRTIINFAEDEKVLVVSTERTNSALKVKNSLGNYLYFDSKDFFTEPYPNTYQDNGGRQYFWNFIIKTSLFGEYKVWNTDFGKNLALALGVFALFLWLISIAGIFKCDRQHIPSLIFLAFLIASLIAARAIYPFSCLSDFRYIMPAIAPLSVFMVSGARAFNSRRLRIFSYVILSLFCLICGLFIVGHT
ncbi:hypothetical protein AGMMS49938_16020 [Fibrobacterales bacterium]|nr:hypothetical protein AGMMS49938_16020 [Fibrobacterales bacterium]